MRELLKYTFYFVLALTVTSCKKQFNPQLISVSTNFLAVDGPILSGDSTFIRLSRTTKLSDTTQNKAELKAIVSVESDQNVLYPLTDKGKGLYVLGVVNFSATRKYRLNIKTADGKIYQSDFVPMKVTPAIDSIYIKHTSPDEITFYVDSHDGTNNTRYYRWEYKDTWQYVSIYRNVYQYKNGVISSVIANSPDDISTCYKSSYSNQLFIGSSSKLSQDVIKEQPLFGVNNTSEKISHTYTIQLKQYALTKDAFEYYEILKRNTEQIGSIFDPQPSMISGNIHCITSPADVVIGFISVSTITRKQFDLYTNGHKLRPIELNQGIEGVTPHAYPQPFYEMCSGIPLNPNTGKGAPWSFVFLKVPDLNVQPAAFYTRANKALSKGDSVLFNIDFSDILSARYQYAPKNCVDCRVKGGTNIRPAYFPLY